MLVIQMTGLSGAGKTTLANLTAHQLTDLGYAVEILDGDQYRQHLWPELTFSDRDRQENIRRLGYLAQRLTHHGIIVLLAAINPFEAIRSEIRAANPGSQLVFVNCDLPTLYQRDTKGLYARASLPDQHPDKLTNLTGVNSPYERPKDADLVIKTHCMTEAEATKMLLIFLLSCLPYKRQLLTTEETV